MNNIEKLQDDIGYKFNNEHLLIQSLTHLSYANETETESYERLEFLGDAIIELVVSDYIFNNYNLGVGDLTKLRSSLVSTDYLCELVVKLGLDKYVLKSKSLQQLSKKNIADIFESLVGAIYIDSGYESAKTLINHFIIKNKENVDYVLQNNIDYKTKLQELMQAKTLNFEYKVISSSGLDHEKVFKVALVINNEIVETAKAGSIHLAEERCAEKYLTGKNTK